MNPDWVRNAKVGDKIVCVRDCDYTALENIMTVPSIGRIYTLRDIFPLDHPALPDLVRGSTFFRFIEINNTEMPSMVGLIEPFFLSADFKPLQTCKTDISVFKEILDRNSLEGVE